MDRGQVGGGGVGRGRDRAATGQRNGNMPSSGLMRPSARRPVDRHKCRNMFSMHRHTLKQTEQDKGLRTAATTTKQNTRKACITSMSLTHVHTMMQLHVNSRLKAQRDWSRRGLTVQSQSVR